jgi:hypothetical protein
METQLNQGLYLASVTDHQPQPPPPSYRASTHEKSSFDIPQRIERKLAQYNASQNTFKRWMFEIISVAVSTLCMGRTIPILLWNDFQTDRDAGAIVGILHYLDAQTLSKWPLGLTIITILSKIASAALILPISEAIGQLKWTWFHGKKSKDAFDFEIFDKASRGAWGSVMLLCRTKGKSLAALGALLTLLLLAIDTFFQQVTDLPERWTVHGESLIPRTRLYLPNVENAYFESTSTNAPLVQFNNDLRKAISPFFYQNGTQPLKNGDATQAEIPLQCPTSKCEWSSYDTLGVCSACEDVSNFLEYACLPMSMDWIRNSTGPSTEATYPNGKVSLHRAAIMAQLTLKVVGTACGYFLNATSAKPVLMSGYRIDESLNASRGETLLMRILPLVTNPARKALWDGSINFKQINYRIMDALIVSAVDGSAESVYRKEVPIAHECVLSWCVKTLRSSYIWGGYQEEVLATFMNTTIPEYPWWTHYIPEEDGTDTEYRSNVTITPPYLGTNSTAFGLSNDTFLDTVIILDEIFPSLLTMANASAQAFMKVRTSFTDRVAYRAVRWNPWLAPNNVTQHMERLAEAITNAIRSDPGSNELFAGIAYSLETFVAVHWAWLAFPLTMLLLSIVFLIATMVKTSRNGHDDIGTWKTSAMPTLIYSLPKEMQKGLTSSGTWDGTASGKRQNMRIRLLPKQGWRLSGHVCTSPTTNIPDSSRQV